MRQGEGINITRMIFRRREGLGEKDSLNQNEENKQRCEKVQKKKKKQEDARHLKPNLNRTGGAQTFGKSAPSRQISLRFGRLRFRSLFRAPNRKGAGAATHLRAEPENEKAEGNKNKTEKERIEKEWKNYQSTNEEEREREPRGFSILFQVGTGVRDVIPRYFLGQCSSFLSCTAIIEMDLGTCAHSFLDYGEQRFLHHRISF